MCLAGTWVPGVSTAASVTSCRRTDREAGQSPGSSEAQRLGVFLFPLPGNTQQVRCIWTSRFCFSRPAGLGEATSLPGDHASDLVSGQHSGHPGLQGQQRWGLVAWETQDGVSSLLDWTGPPSLHLGVDAGLGRWTQRGPGSAKPRTFLCFVSKSRTASSPSAQRPARVPVQASEASTLVRLLAAPLAQPVWACSEPSLRGGCCPWVQELTWTHQAGFPGGLPGQMLVPLGGQSQSVVDTASVPALGQQEGSQNVLKGVNLVWPVHTGQRVLWSCRHG